MIGSLKLGNVWVFVQLIHRPTRTKNQLQKTNIAQLDTSMYALLFFLSGEESRHGRGTQHYFQGHGQVEGFPGHGRAGGATSQGHGPGATGGSRRREGDGGRVAAHRGRREDQGCHQVGHGAANPFAGKVVKGSHDPSNRQVHDPGINTGPNQC